MVANISATIPGPVTWKLSPDKKKILFFNARQIRVAELKRNGDDDMLSEPYFTFDCRDNSLRDIFWHSDSYHLILVTHKNIEALEIQPGSQLVDLLALSKKNIDAHYDTASDTLYFMDSQKAGDGNYYENVYKLEMAGSKIFALQDQFKANGNE
ncbi:MAG: hypothetical protein NTY47_01260 [Candidatus Omnitrophica bacterium]|nr:hypothetical protein [Candidatus Omnitrophota bacterium]